MSARLPRFFSFFLLGAFLSNIGSWMQVIAQGWLVAELSKEPFWSGFVNFCAGIPMLLFSLPGGALSDRFNRRKVVVICQIIMMFNAALIAFLTKTGWIQLWQVALISFIGGTTFSVNNPAYSGFLYNIAGKEGLSRALSLTVSQFQFSRVIGPALGGLAIGIIGTWGCFTLNALSFLCVIPLLYLIPVREVQDVKTTRGKSFWKSLREAMEYARTHPKIGITLVITALSSCLIMPHIFLLPLYIQRDRGLDAHTLGWLWGVSAIGSFLSSVVIERWGRTQREIRPRDLHLGMIVSAVGLFCFANVRALPLMYFFIFCVGISMGFIAVASQLLIQSHSPQEFQGRLLGIWGSLFQGMFPIGNLALGAVAQFSSLPIAWSFASVVCVILFFVLDKRVKAAALR